MLYFESLVRDELDTLMSLWRRMECENKLYIFEADGEIQSYQDFVEALLKLPVYLFYRDDEIIGFCWLTNPEGRSIRVHFMVFDSGVMSCVKLGRKFCKWFINSCNEKGEYLYDVVIGVTPIKLQLVLRFIQLIGFKSVGTIPHFYGEGESAGLFTLTRR